MPFETITHTKVNPKTNTPISKNSVKIYKSLLNRLAQGGFDTKESLLADPDAVITLIDTVIDGDTDNDRAEKRKYYSAIFYALDQYLLQDKQPYYDAFQKAKQNYGKVEDDAVSS